MSDQYTGVVCRGSFALGTACGKCERCKDAIERYEAGQSFDAALNTPSAALREIRDLKAQLAAKDALIRGLVGSIKLVNNWRPDTTLHAALTSAKEAGYE